MHIQYNATYNKVDNSVTISRGVVKLNDLDDSIVWEDYFFIKDPEHETDDVMNNIFNNSGNLPVVLRIKDVELEVGDLTYVFDNVILSLPKNTSDDYRMEFPINSVIGVINEEGTAVAETDSMSKETWIVKIDHSSETTFTSRIPDALDDDISLVYIAETENTRDILMACKSTIPLVIYK